MGLNIHERASSWDTPEHLLSPEQREYVLAPKLAIGWGGDIGIGEQPDATAIREQQAPTPDPSLRRDYTDTLDSPAAPDSYNWVMIGERVIMSKDQSPEQMVGAHGYHNVEKPLAYGRVMVHYRWNADFQIIHSNIGLQYVFKTLKRYAKDEGWQVRAFVDHNGQELGLPKKSNDVGVGDHTVYKEWRRTDGDHNWGQDVEQSPYHGEQDPEDLSKIKRGLYECPDCGTNFGDYKSFLGHQQEHIRKKDWHTPADPVIDYDKTMPADYNTLVSPGWLVQPNAHVAAEEPDYTPPGPIPFIFDIDKDRVYVGHPGETTKEIPAGGYNPLGVVEGLYKPDGQVEIRTQTNMPYTIRHLIQLWYYMHPELEVNGVTMLYADGKSQKLAAVAEGLRRMRLATQEDVGQKIKALLPTDPAAEAVYHALSPYGEVYVVGGAVRDLALGRVPKDIDIMVRGIDPNAIIEVLQGLPGTVKVTGNQFPVIRYVLDGYECEIALPRRDISTGGGGKHDFEVDMDVNMPVEEDLLRRDFTVNAMAVDLNTGELIDPYGGWDDAEAGKLRLVNPRAFEQDATRLLRALSSRSRHGLLPDDATIEAMKQYAHRLSGHKEDGSLYVPNEQISAELEKMMKGDDPSEAVELALKSGLLEHFLPEVAATHGFDQKNKHHSQELFEHISSVLRHMAEINKDPDARLAALLHDIGKPASQWIDEHGRGHYYEKQLEDGSMVGADHQDVGADMASERLRGLGYGNSNRIDRIEHLVRSHMFPAFRDPKGARRFLAKYGDEHADDLLDLRQADSGNKASPWDGDTADQRALVAQVRENNEATTVRDLAINGNDVVQALGIRPGPEVGQALNYLQEQVLENPALNSREALLGLLMGRRQSNILDEVQEGLDIDVWEDPESPKPRIRPHIAEWVRKTIEHLLRDNGYAVLLEDYSLYLTGSLTTYQWSHKSDFDVSLFTAYDQFPEFRRADIIALMVEHLDGVLVPGTTHVLQCYVVGKNIPPEMLYRPGLRSAFDLRKEKWIVPPERERAQDVHYALPHLMAHAKEQADKLRLLLTYDPEAATRFKKALHKRRIRDQVSGKGDFSQSNIIYKWLEHDGLLNG